MSEQDSPNGKTASTDRLPATSCEATSSAQEQDSLTLKWGTLKGWKLKSPKAFELFKQWAALGSSMSAMMQRDTPEQKQLICEIIDAANLDTVCLDWEDKEVSKEEAKRYVMEYGKREQGSAGIAPQGQADAPSEKTEATESK